MFFTVCLRDQRSALLVDRIDVLRESFSRVLTLPPFRVDAWVVLPDHMHRVWTWPEGDAEYSRRWQALLLEGAQAGLDDVLGRPVGTGGDQ